MTSSSSLYGSVTTQNSSSGNSTSLYGEAGTPIPDSSGNVIVRGDLYVLSGNILTTATTGNIFPANATTVNLGLAATAVNIGADSGTTTINNDLVVDGTFTAAAAQYGNIQIAVTNDNTIDTVSGDLLLNSATGNIGLIGSDTLYTDQSTFLLLNSPTTVTAFDSATTLNFGDTTGTTFIRNDLAVGGDLKINGNDIKSNGGTTAITLSGADVTVANDLTITGNSVNLAQATTIAYSENNNRANRPEVQSTTGNGSGFRVLAPNATTSASSNLTVFATDDIDNGEFMTMNANGSTTVPFAFRTGKYTAGVQGASGKPISFTDSGTLFASINPAGPTNGFDLTTKTYVDGIVGDASKLVNGSYEFVLNADGTVETPSEIYAAGPLTLQGATFNPTSLVLDSESSVTTLDAGIGGDSATLTAIPGSLTWDHVADPMVIGSVDGIWSFNADGTTSFPNYNFPYADGSANQILKTDGAGFLSWYSPADLNTTYTVDASTTTGGANFNLVGSDSTTDTIKFANGTNVTVTATDANTITIAATDTNTTYTIDATSTTGGANLNLAGSDSSTDSVAYLGSGATTVTRTDANTITISSVDTNTTYTQDVSSTTGGANVNLNGSDSSVDSVAYKGAGSVTVTATDASTVTITGTDTNTTYTVDATSTTGGANLNLVGSDSTTDSVKFAGGTNVTVVATDANTMTINATDTNTTYDFAATSTTGGANLNLTGSDATTDTVKLTNGGHITAAYTSATEVTLGSDATDANTVSTIVARDSSGNFSAGTISMTKGLVGSTANFTDWPNAQFVASQANGGDTHTYNIGAVGEAVADSGDANRWGVGVYGNGFTNGGVRSAGVLGDGSVTNTADSGSAVGVRGYSTDTHAGGLNIGLYADASGSSIGNYALYMNEGNIISVPAQTWTVVDNNASALSIDATGKTGILKVVSTDGDEGVTMSGTLGVTGVATLGNGSRTLGAHYGTQSTTWTPPASGLTTLTGSNGFQAASSSGGANGYGALVSATYYSGDTTAGTASSAALGGRGATGTNTSPTAASSAQVLLSVNADGYATTGWASSIATANSGGGTAVITPAQLQFYTREAFADNGTAVTAGGTGMRVRLFNAATTLSAANRVSIIDHTTSVATYKAAAFNIQPAASANNYATFGATTGSINQDTFTLKNNAATTTYATFNSTSATLNGDTVSLRNTAGTSTWASFATGGATITTAGPATIIRTSAVAASPAGEILRLSRTDQTGPQDSDGIDFRLSVGGTSTVSNFARFDGVYKSSGLNEIGMSVSTDSFAADTDRIYIGTRESTKIRTTPAGGGTASDTATFTQLATTLKTDSLVIQNAAGTSLVGNNISYNRVYGQWQYDATITPAASNTAYAYPIASGVTDFANIASVGSTSRIIPGAAGMYKLQFSIQIENSDNTSEHTAYFWWRKNGTDVPASMGRVGVVKQTGGGTPGATIAGWDNMISSANTTDYWELMYAVDSATHVTFPFYSAPAFGPTTASAFITLVPVGA